MKIGIDVRKIDDYGIGTHIRNVVLPAADLAKDCEFYFYYDRSTSASAVPEKPRQKWIDEPAAKYSVWEHISLARRSRADQLSLFHSPHYTLPLFLGVPSIVTVHDLIHFKFQKYFPAWKVHAAEFVIKQAVQKAESVIAVSETTRNDLVQWMPSLEPKIRVIYNRLTEDWFEPAPAVDTGSLGIDADFVLYVGNFKKHKRIDTLVDAWSSDSDGRLPQLVLVGQGHQADHELSHRLLSMSRVRVLGFSRPRILRALYAKALLFVFPSEYEGFGYPPLEAMAAGCPVLSSDAPAMKEVLGSGAEFFRCGNLEDFVTKLTAILQDTHRRKTLAKAGLEQARRFATDDSPRKLAMEWNHVLKGKKRR